MAKNNYLFRFFLCLIAGLCIGIGGVVVESFQQSAISFQSGLGDRANGIDSFQKSAISCQSVSIPSVNLSAMQWSRKISPLEAGRLDAEVIENIVRNEIKQIYSAEIGVREKTGKNDGARVEEYLAVTQLGKGYAWCAAFVSWVFSEAGFPEPRTPWSPALFPKKRVIWERGRKGVRSEVLDNRVGHLKNTLTFSNTHNLKPNAQYLTPQTADVFGIYFANLKRIAHVGFVDEWGEKQVITVEGNTNEAGSGEGDGVYRKRRPIASIYQVANWIDLEEEL